MPKIAPLGRDVPPIIRILRSERYRSSRLATFADGPPTYAMRFSNRLDGQLLRDFRHLSDHLPEGGRGANIILDHSMEGGGSLAFLYDHIVEVCGERGIRSTTILTQNVLEKRFPPESPLQTVYLHHYLFVLARNHAQFLASTSVEDFVAERLAARRTPTKLFSALMHRPRSARIVVFGWLLRHGALDHGHVSFYGGSAKLGRRSLEEYVDLAREEFPDFADCIDAAEASGYLSTGYKNFTEDDVRFSTSIYTPGVVGSPMSLVTETEMGGPADALRFTEKSLKPTLWMQGFLVAANAGTMGLLADLGLADTTFDSSYDTIEDLQERMRAVLDTFDRYLAAPAHFEVPPLGEAVSRYAEMATRFQDQAAAVTGAAIARLEDICFG